MTVATTRGRLVVVLLALLAGATALLSVPSTHGALTGRVTNSTNTAVSAVINTSSCNQAVNAAPKAQAAYPLADSSGPNAANVITGAGSTGPGAYSSTGVTYGVAGPCPRDAWKGVALDGFSGFVRGPSAKNPTAFSVQVWFRTTDDGGGLIGFGDNTGTSGTSSNYDRNVYMAANGHLYFGVNPPGGRQTIRSPATYNDNRWHHVVATLEKNGTLKGTRLYVDGALVASDANASNAQNFDGVWRFGGDNLSFVLDDPGSDYFLGSIGYAAVWTSALTAAQVRTLYNAGR